MGTLRWKDKIHFGSDAVIGANGLVYVGSDSSTIFILDGDGLRSWNYYGSGGGASYTLFDGSPSVFEVDATGAEVAFTLYGADGLGGRQTKHRRLPGGDL